MSHQIISFTGEEAVGRGECNRMCEEPSQFYQLPCGSVFEEVVWASETMRNVLRQVATAAPSNSTVLLLGETGTGKELLARALHRLSNRSTMPFVTVNCAAIPQALIASELFGHEKGSFTGAHQRRLGRFESANGGTLFLDEVGDLPPETQTVLLRVLQEREIERIGCNRPIAIDVRIIAATNRNLLQAVNDRTFRSDLFYRLSVLPIQVPPLRDRADEIPILLRYFIERYATQAGKKVAYLKKSTIEALKAYDWPGNIRELQNVVERAVAFCDGDEFGVEDAWLQKTSKPSSMAAGMLAAVSEREREIIEAALTKCRGRVSGNSGAAILLGIPRTTLEYKIARHGIDKFHFRAGSKSCAVLAAS
jgi:transcriptional regulator with GAF, ATPase, and Fis domain